jgi:hypothetical protein
MADHQVRRDLAGPPSHSCHQLVKSLGLLGRYFDIYDGA